MADRTLRTLIAVSRSKPVERELCCPECGGGVALVDGRYLCVSWFRSFASLAELAVRPDPRDRTVFVCPECHASRPEPHAPWCPDMLMRQAWREEGEP